MISSAKRWAIWRAESMLGEDLRALGVLGVVEEAAHDEATALNTNAAEGDHSCAGRSSGPLAEVDLRLRAGSCLGCKALRDHVEDAGSGKVREEGCVEGLFESACVRGHGLEASGSEPNARRTLVDVDLEVLRMQRGRNSREKQERED
jgi:hypothetical protein